jgi:alkane 1-monooxygenase
MIGLTYFPPLWRRMMDHRVLAHYGGDITQVNIQPRVRDKVLARYGAAADERSREEKKAADERSREEQGGKA